MTLTFATVTKVRNLIAGRRGLRRWALLRVTLALVISAVFVVASAPTSHAASVVPFTTPVRHGCSLIGAPAGGYQAVACADIWDDRAYPYAGGEASCRRTSDLVTVQCSGVSQTLQLWNYTKSRLAHTSPTFTCGYYASYAPRCDTGRNYQDDFNTYIAGCDQAYVIARTTVRLPGTNKIVSGFASTSNYRNSGC